MGLDITVFVYAVGVCDRCVDGRFLLLGLERDDEPWAGNQGRRAFTRRAGRILGDGQPDFVLYHHDDRGFDCADG